MEHRSTGRRSSWAGGGLWVAWVAGALVARDAAAQGLPVARAVLALDGTEGCPSVPTTHTPLLVLTTEGIARHTGDGSYTWLCPSRWGGARDVHAVSDPSGRELLVLADGVAWLSGDSGCSGQALPLPAGALAVDAVHWRQAFWVLTGGGTDGLAYLLRREGDGFLTVSSWEDFRPDGMAPEGPDRLWLAGALPEPQVRRLSLAGGLSGDAPVAVLPDDRRDLDRLRPVAAADGEAWLVARRRSDQWTWHARVDVEDTLPVVTVSDDGARYTFLAGPARLDGAWVASFDGDVATAIPGQGAWTATGASVDWITLSATGDRLFSGSIEGMRAVLDLSEEGRPRERRVWVVQQVAGPGTLCPASAICDADWAAAAAEAGIDVEDEPAVCPDGRTASDLDPSACACDSGGTGWPAWALAAGWLRRRRLAPHRGTCSGGAVGGAA